jgi:hypothetical protein
MSEPVRKIKQTPESYNPKNKPEIIKVAAESIAPTTVSELQTYIASGGEPPKSNKIAGIRRLWHDDKSENFQLEGCFTAVMKAAGESPDFNCALFEAISGTLYT